MIFIKEQNNQILKTLQDFQTSVNSCRPFQLPKDLAVSFPLKSMQDIELLKKYLESPENVSALVRALYNIKNDCIIYYVFHICFSQIIFRRLVDEK